MSPKGMQYLSRSEQWHYNKLSGIIDQTKDAHRNVLEQLKTDLTEYITAAFPRCGVRIESGSLRRISVLAFDLPTPILVIEPVVEEEHGGVSITSVKFSPNHIRPSMDIIQRKDARELVQFIVTALRSTGGKLFPMYRRAVSDGLNAEMAHRQSLVQRDEYRQLAKQRSTDRPQ